MDLQPLYLRRLWGASGARARVEDGTVTAVGTWRPEAGGFRLEPGSETGADPECPAALTATVHVELSTGVHSFPATVRPCPEGVWEVTPAGPVTVHEARAHVRFPGPIRASLGVPDGSSRLPVTLDDLALGGVAFRWATEVAVGTALTLGFPEERGLDALPIEVVRCAPDRGGYQVGARFTSLPAGAADRLVELLAKSRRPDQGGS